MPSASRAHCSTPPRGKRACYRELSLVVYTLPFSIFLSLSSLFLSLFLPALLFRTLFSFVRIHRPGIGQHFVRTKAHDPWCVIRGPFCFDRRSKEVTNKHVMLSLLLSTNVSVVIAILFVMCVYIFIYLYICRSLPWIYIVSCLCTCVLPYVRVHIGVRVVKTFPICKNG